MKRVVKGFEREIAVESVEPSDICVGKRGSQLYKLHKIDERWGFCFLTDSRTVWNTKGSVYAAVDNFMSVGGGEVYVLDSLSELADWIKDNS